MEITRNLAGSPTREALRMYEIAMENMDNFGILEPEDCLAATSEGLDEGWSLKEVGQLMSELERVSLVFSDPAHSRWIVRQPALPQARVHEIASAR